MMRKLFFLLSVLLPLLFVSCTKPTSGGEWVDVNALLNGSRGDKNENTSGSASPFVGKWKVSGLMGHGSLEAISSISIGSSTVTMTFTDGYYDALYKAYGSSRTVKYTYKQSELTPDERTRMSSLTFDEPLYFVDYATDRYYVSKVFLSKNDGFISWTDDHMSNVLLLEK